MVREIITINVGGCGIQVGDAMWKQYCQEHQISADGTVVIKDKLENSRLNYFFDERKDGGDVMSFTPRNLFVDCESDSMDKVKSGDLSFYHKDGFITNYNDSASHNYAHGYYNCGADIVKDFNCQTRKLIEQCDRINSFVLNRNTTGGSGSGLATLVLFRIRDDFGLKTNILDTCIVPSSMSSATILPVISSCNTLLALSKGIECQNILSMVFDNKSLYKQSKKYELKKLNDDYYLKLNDVISKTISNVTLSMRSDGAYLPCFLDEFTENLVPFPRFHFVISSMSRAGTKKTKEAHGTINHKFESVTKKCFKHSNFGVQFSNVFVCLSFFCFFLF